MITRQMPVVDLMPSMTGTETISRIGQACIDLIKHHEGLALTGEAEGVHQMRVATRRSRSVLSGFRDHLSAHDYKWANGELRWLGRVLGQARDIDVFEKLIDQSKSDLPDVVHIEKPISDIKAIAYNNVKETIQTPRYLGLNYALTQWFDRGIAINVTLRTVVPAILDERYHEVSKAGAKFSKQGKKKRHRFRLALKKLRYSTELFGVLYDEPAVLSFINQLKQLQDDLGEANDVRNGHDIVADFTAEFASLVSIGQNMIDWHQKRIDRHESRLHRHVDQFFETKRFWKRD